MEKKISAGPLATNAYRIFLHELEDHLRAVNDVMVQETQLLEADIIAIGGRLHKIKGAAGIFGLGNLSRVAAELEEEMKQPISSIERRQTEIRELFVELEREAGEAPAPQTSAEAGKRSSA